MTLTSTPNIYLIGRRPTLRATFKADGVLADPTVIKCIIQKPDGIETTYTFGVGLAITRTGVGAYQIDVLTDQVGSWLYRWEGSGAVIDAAEGQFEVIPSEL